MNGALAGLILVFLLVLYVGKHVRRPGPRAYLFIVAMSAIQVAVVLYFVFHAEPPAQ